MGFGCVKRAELYADRARRSAVRCCASQSPPHPLLKYCLVNGFFSTGHKKKGRERSVGGPSAVFVCECGDDEKSPNEEGEERSGWWGGVGGGGGKRKSEKRLGREKQLRGKIR